ncbi:heavy-metal-associated domain-containing protein [Bordetella avium]|uniref:Heavy metal transport protein n=1 Tax=Bordetella avium (strain 197N) TaxID=360910 RepID=Q2L019_BORA1|nr:heavy-metal-associated domain-containing protein [Bordetella avium]AZY50912.1 copper chaperone [Bordetella avium]AZY54307.1 copper chaperone [Bordetella avium]RIQ12872.1 copper chaperone [Bordetella avium]RIQ19417.1 copper chaperone [Bordetella avium]RIQ32113.1 copper chaperone [Bordetella avium]
MSVVFTVSDMTCGHCAKTITQAVQAAVPGAEVSVDLSAHRVSVNPSEAAAAIEAAIRNAGYDPKKIN